MKKKRGSEVSLDDWKICALVLGRADACRYKAVEFLALVQVLGFDKAYCLVVEKALPEIFENGQLFEGGSDRWWRQDLLMIISDACPETSRDTGYPFRWTSDRWLRKWPPGRVKKLVVKALLKDYAEQFAHR